MAIHTNLWAGDAIVDVLLAELIGVVVHALAVVPIGGTFKLRELVHP